MLEIETPRNYQKIDEDSSQIQINPLKVVIESKLKKDNKSCQFSENFFLILQKLKNLQKYQIELFLQKPNQAHLFQVL